MFPAARRALHSVLPLVSFTEKWDQIASSIQSQPSTCLFRMSVNVAWLILLTCLIHSGNSLEDILKFELNFTDSRIILAPLFQQYDSLPVAMEKMTTLDKNTEFIPLFNYIVNNSSIYSQLIPRLDIILAFNWSSSMDTEGQRLLMKALLDNSPDVLYNLMLQDYFLTKEANCQELLDAIISTEIKEATQLILEPVAIEYFEDKRCIFLRSSFLERIDEEVKVDFDLEEKLQLVPILKRINVVHSLIFKIR